MPSQDTLDSYGKYIPKYLLSNQDANTLAANLVVDKEKFQVVCPGLKIDSNYAFQFQYVFSDGSLSEWSPSYTLNTSTETVPGSPTASVPSTAVGSIPVTLSSFPANAKRVDVYIIGGEFGSGKIADYFLTAGTKNISVAGGVYQVSLITVTPSGINGNPTNTFTITVSIAGETVQSPTNPNGFSITRVLGGIEVSWAGTYANGTFTGFEAIKVYVGNSATATSETYKEGGVMTGNNVKNTIIIPVDGTYLRYNQPVYIHAAAVNKNGAVGTLQENVANDLLGARSAIASDLDNQIITNQKLVDGAVTEAKIATSAITETKIATDSVTSSKIIANAITADKIATSAITADKIATNAVTAGKILAGTIDVSKLAAGTISVNNLESGTLTSTSFIRAGSTGGGARVELSSAAISGGPSAGFYIYNSAGTAVLSAPLSGGLSIIGSGTFSGNLSAAGGTFNGDITASNGLFSVSNGVLTAQSGTIGGWDINGTQLRSTGTNSITLNPLTPKIALLQSGVEKITIDPVQGIKDSAGNFTLTPGGNLTLKGSITSGSTITGASIQGGSVTVSSTFNSGTLSAFSDSGLVEGSDVDANGTDASIYSSSYSPTLTVASGKISSDSILQLSGNSYTEILSGGTQSAMFSNDKSSLKFTTGLYLGDPNKSSQSNVQSTTSSRVPWISIDASLRLRKGAPLLYPGGTTGAYVRNIYIKQTTATTISSTTGNIGDIFITY